MADAATNQEVVLWYQSRFPNFKQRGPVSQVQADAYNRAHPERPFTGPVRSTSGLTRANNAAKYSLNAAQKAMRGES